MRLNIFNQVNLQRACGYQAVVVSGCSGAVRLSLHSFTAMAGCDCLHMFCLGILQRSACFFYPSPPSLVFFVLFTYFFLSMD